MCQSHRTSEGFPGAIPAQEVAGDGDKQSCAKRRAGEDHGVDPQSMASPQPLPRDTQFL